MPRSDNLYSLPPNLPVPVDDGACDHLPGMRLPDIALRSTAGGMVSLPQIDAKWVITYFYPRTGVPDQDPPGGLAKWDAIPGSRGCTPQSCEYRDHHGELAAMGARVYGMSTQDTEYQSEAASRLRLPFELLSDADLRFAVALRLPTFVVEGQTLIKRLTLIARGGVVERCFYPVFPPTADAGNVLQYLHERSA
jgi:peroxiredoxin